MSNAKKAWSRPTIQTVSGEELKKLVMVSACSDFICMYYSRMNPLEQK